MSTRRQRSSYRQPMVYNRPERQADVGRALDGCRGVDMEAESVSCSRGAQRLLYQRCSCWPEAIAVVTRC